ncbi:MAG: UDP-N-acetylglucosamine 2-epimerase (non-hydrolyzing) [Candidatus Margulisbacteria bacterium]|nr:UDP-N-acetylglucosamine 2-epimerase (non-hydrolyzing) [Candidatus Margulisiibacteriota bacterium]
MNVKKKIMFVFGTRPEAIKMAPVIAVMGKDGAGLEPIVVVTAQHRQMLDQVLDLFKIKVDHDLNIMEENQNPPKILTKSLTGLEKIIDKEKPDMILAQGDTSTTFAAGLAAYYSRIPLGHVEAGLRTFDKWHPFPEEINRKLTTSLADLHFAPTQTAVNHLLEEKVPQNSIYLTGNTVIDALLDVVKKDFSLEQAGIKLDPKKKTILVTTHRRENFGQPLKNICQAAASLAKKHADSIQFVIPVHKNPEVKKTVHDILSGFNNVMLTQPLAYEPFIHLMKQSYIILTDSGGVQEEAPSLGKPVLVLREKTERPEAVDFGTVKLVGLSEEAIFEQTEKLLLSQQEYKKMSQSVNPYGDGRAAGRIVDAIKYYFGIVKNKPEEFAVK